MQFKLILYTNEVNPCIPVNYQYPLSSVIYKIISKGNLEYAKFLHESGYGKGFKLFSFSQIDVPFRISGDRLYLKSNELSFSVSFHIPQALDNFVKGLFLSERIEIADKYSRACFSVKSIESLPNRLSRYRDNEIINVTLHSQSLVVASLHNERGYHEFLSPDDPRFTESLVYNWRSKIVTCYDEVVAQSAILLMEVIPAKLPFKSRLITIKTNTPHETKIKGWLNFDLKVTAEKRFVELLTNVGVGLYNSQGGGFTELL